MDMSYIPDMSDSYDTLSEGNEPTMDEVMQIKIEISEYLYCSVERMKQLLAIIKEFESTPNVQKKIVVQRDVNELETMIGEVKKWSRLL
ncbi:MAG: hypothetical protein ACQETE_02435 [Bacteroidota bacterium]